MTSSHWPELALDAWQDTYTTLHLWTQIAGKVRLVQTPWMNHSWHVPFYLSVRGLTTGPIPYGSRIFQIDLTSSTISSASLPPPISSGPLP